MSCVALWQHGAGVFVPWSCCKWGCSHVSWSCCKWGCSHVSWSCCKWGCSHADYAYGAIWQLGGNVLVGLLSEVCRWTCQSPGCLGVTVSMML
jgi:hypothetical protein